MNYSDVYFSRVNHLGQTTAQRIRSAGTRSFIKWMAESPHTVRQLCAERGIYFDAIILENKDKEYKKIMFLNVLNETNIHVGDIIDWKQDDGSIEKWLLFQEEKKVNGSYKTFWIVRCNYLLKWIDSLGHLQQSWSYVLSSVDSKIKGNYRTWNNLITPQPNKYAEILMPRYPIDRATNFIIEDESWQVIEYDHTSVPGVIYLSLTENKINLIYDDTINNIADTDKLAQYIILAPAEMQIFAVGDIIEPAFTLTKNGVPINMDVILTSEDKSVAKLVDNVLTAVGEGETTIIATLKDYPEISTTMRIKVDNETTLFSAYIEGAATIRLNRASTYILKGTDEIVGEVVYSLSATTLAVIENQENNICTIKANSNNELGNIELIATYNNVSYTKTIEIVPLW